MKRPLATLLRPAQAPIIVALATALLGLILLVWLGAGLTRQSYDIPFVWRKNLKADEIRLVYLDDDSYKQLNPSLVGPLNRSIHAQLVDRLTAQGARAIVFDIVFDGPSADPRADQQFADAIRRSRRVILSGIAETEPALHADKPDDAFLAGAAGWGYANFNSDPRLTDKFFPDPPDLPGAPGVPWLDRRVAQLLGAKDLAASEDGWFNFVGPPGSFASASYYQALLTNGVPPGFFQNKIVFIGDKRVAGPSGQTKDSFDTPYSDWGWAAAPGVDLHATAVFNLLHHNWLHRPPPWLEMLIVILTAVVASFALMRLPPLWACAAAGAVVLLTLAAFLLHWYAHLWFAWLVLAVQIGAALVASLVYNSLQSYVQKRLLEDRLSARLAPAVVKGIKADSSADKLGGKRDDLSIIFTDIADFTRICEMNPPEDVVKALIEYYTVAVRCIHQTDGTILSFIGDAIFAIWNAPLPQTDHRQRACRAAVSLRRHLARFQPTNRSLPVFRTRIGLHSGSAVVGNVGGADRFSYTAISSHINFASRLEGLNKYFATNVLASRELQAVVENDFAWRFIGNLKPKGAAAPPGIYELIGGPDQIESSRPWREKFADALQDFRDRQFDAAAEKFKAVNQLRLGVEPDLATASGLSPEDGPSKFYLERIKEFRDKPPPEGWLGDIELKEK